MMNAPVPPGAPPPGIPPGGPPGAGPQGPMPAMPGPPPPAPPPTIPAQPPGPVFKDLPSRLPVGIQLIDGAARQCKKALGTLEFVSNPPERAALLALTQDLDNLITKMTKKTVGNKNEDSESPSDLSSEDEL